jgi:class 3 adenylate cyclase
VARMPIPQPWFHTREDYEAIRHLVTDESQLFDTFEEWLHAANERFEKFIGKGIAVKKVFVDPQEFTAWCSATNAGYNRASFLAFVIAASTKQ